MNIHIVSVINLSGFLFWFSSINNVWIVPWSSGWTETVFCFNGACLLRRSTRVVLLLTLSSLNCVSTDLLISDMNSALFIDLIFLYWMFFAGRGGLDKLMEKLTLQWLDIPGSSTKISKGDSFDRVMSKSRIWHFLWVDSATCCIKSNGSTDLENCLVCGSVFFPCECWNT